MDLMAFIEKSIILEPGKSSLVPTGLSVAFPKEYEIQIRPRSGLAAKNNISVLNTPGTIDSDYRGELKIILFNHGNENFTINNNDRVAQMVLTPIVKMDLDETNELPGERELPHPRSLHMGILAHSRGLRTLRQESLQPPRRSNDRQTSAVSASLGTKPVSALTCSTLVSAAAASIASA